MPPITSPKLKTLPMSTATVGPVTGIIPNLRSDQYLPPVPRINNHQNPVALVPASVEGTKMLMLAESLLFPIEVITTVWLPEEDVSDTLLETD